MTLLELNWHQSVVQVDKKHLIRAYVPVADGVTYTGNMLITLEASQTPSKGVHQATILKVMHLFSSFIMLIQLAHIRMHLNF